MKVPHYKIFIKFLQVGTKDLKNYFNNGKVNSNTKPTQVKVVP